jgi:hypothetical protein
MSLARSAVPAVLCLLVTGLAGCGRTAHPRRQATGGRRPAQVRSTRTSPTTSTRTATTRPSPRVPAVGVLQRTASEGSHLQVRVERVIDPLEGSGASLLPGTRAVGVIVQISNSGPELYDSSATGDFSLIVSRGSALPLFVPHGSCETPLNDFDRYMLPGVTRSGCVAFDVAVGATVLEVRFSPHSRPLGRLAWRVAAG